MHTLLGMGLVLIGIVKFQDKFYFVHPEVIRQFSFRIIKLLCNMRVILEIRRIEKKLPF